MFLAVINLSFKEQRGLQARLTDMVRDILGNRESLGFGGKEMPFVGCVDELLEAKPANRSNGLTK